jgi:multiple sugar transport system ATP-binding protein
VARIRLKNLEKIYGQVRAVVDLSLDISDREFLVIIGPSGAGKTSTLKMIAGVEPVSGGAILIDDTNVTDLSPKDRDVAMAFESFSLYPHKNVFENIAFPLRAPGNHLEDEEIRERVLRVAQLLQIEPLLERRADQLSGGQRQRVALGRAVVREPKAFLMDEPLSHLDARIRHRMRGELRRLADTINVTSVYVTHDYVEALGLGDRVAVIDRGHLLQVGPARTIFDRPATSTVARLIGQPEINLFEGVVGHGDSDGHTNGLTFRTTDGCFSIRVPESTQGGARLNDRKVIVGIRPQHIQLSESQSRHRENQARLLGIEDHITKYLITLALGDSVVRVATSHRIGARAGDQITVQTAPDRCLVFDAATHETLGTLEDTRWLESPS